MKMCIKKTKNQLFKFDYRTLAPMLAMVSLAFFASCDSILSDNLNPISLNAEEGEVNDNIVDMRKSERMNIMDLLAIAADRAFEQSNEKISSRCVTSNSATDKAASDLVKIHRVVHYSLENIKFGIGGIGGGDKIDILVADFDIIQNAEETKQQAGILNEVVIVFKGESGIYPYLLKSINHTSEYDEWFFSDKMSIENYEVIERGVRFCPSFQYYLKIEKASGIALFRQSIINDCPLDIEIMMPPPEVEDWVKLSDPQIIDTGVTFNTSDLCIMPQMSVLGTTFYKGTYAPYGGKDYIDIRTGNEYNLTRVYFDEHTQLFDKIYGTTPITYEDLIVGDSEALEITFDKLHENYNPREVIANEVSIVGRNLPPRE